MSDTIIRELAEGDIQAFIDLCQEQAAETIPHMSFERDVVERYAQDAIMADDFLVLLAERDDALIGFPVGFANPYMFCRGVTCEQEIMYVRLQNRGGFAAAGLIRAFTLWAEEKQALETYTGVANAFHTERATSFFKRAGYEPVGTYLRKIRHDLLH